MAVRMMKSEFQNNLWDRLGKSSQGAIGLGIQQKVANKNRQQELQDAVKKAVIEKALSGQVKGADINSLMSGGMPDLNSLSITPDLRTQRLNRQMENERRLGVMSGLEEPSAEEIGSFIPTMEQGAPAMGIAPSGAVNPQVKQMALEGMRGKFAGGVPIQDLQRKAMGIPFTGKAAQGITPTKALDIISDPFKSREFKRKYPDLYPLLEKMAKEAISGQAKFSGTASNNAGSPGKNYMESTMDTNW